MEVGCSVSQWVLVQINQALSRVHDLQTLEHLALTASEPRDDCTASMEKSWLKDEHDALEKFT